MKPHSRAAFPMSGAALLLLAAATPAVAGHSSGASRANRAEIEATRQLNLQAAQAAQPQIAATDAAANVPDNTPPVAAPTAPIQSAQMTPVTTAGP